MLLDCIPTYLQTDRQPGYTYRFTKALATALLIHNFLHHLKKTTPASTPTPTPTPITQQQPISQDVPYLHNVRTSVQRDLQVLANAPRLPRVHHHDHQQQPDPELNPDLNMHHNAIHKQQPLAIAREALHGQRPQRLFPPSLVAVAVE